MLEAREPDLAKRLGMTMSLSNEVRWAVEGHLADELMPEFRGPDWEPTAYGLAIEDAIDRFIRLYPIDKSGP